MTVVVTGAASGIGLAIARTLVADGTAVVGVDLVEGEFVTVVGDVGDWDTHERAADAAGGLTGWVNNAGINVSGPAHTVGPDEIAAGLRVLQRGPMYGTAVAVRRLLRTGGSIVNVSSIQGVAAFPGFFVYQAAKAAVNMITKGVAVDYGPFGIRCNAVLPGPVETPMMLAGVSVEYPLERIRADAAAAAPLARVCQPEEVAAVVRFLLSERASYVSGALVPIDGGASARSAAPGSPAAAR